MLLRHTISRRGIHTFTAALRTPVVFFLLSFLSLAGLAGCGKTLIQPPQAVEPVNSVQAQAADQTAASQQAAEPLQPDQAPETVSAPVPVIRPSAHKILYDLKESGNKMAAPTAERIKQQIYQQYREWKGTKYVYGGMSKRGIDCSGFTCLTYRKYFGIRLPRTVMQQVRTGVQIDKSELQPGDLVFFKTRILARHVGIYIENGNFLHVSSSHGVTISSIDNIYWKSHYWQSRRNHNVAKLFEHDANKLARLTRDR